MKTIKVILCASALVSAGPLAVPTTYAAQPKSEETKAAEAAERKLKKEAKDAEDLAKYDADKDGKLSKDEKAARKADADKAKAEAKAKREAEKKEKDKTS
jgi:hypothetical protein